MKLLKQILGSLSDKSLFTRRCRFKNIVAHEYAKNVLSLALQSTEPVHVILVGPMGIGKTEMLLETEKYVGKENSHFAIGSRISKAGLSDLLLQNSNIEYLFIDEMEAMSRKDQAVLLSVQQHGIVSETLHGKVREANVSITVFATSNDTRRLLPALVSRFFIVNLTEYKYDEFIKVSKTKLAAEGVIEEAEFIADYIFNTLPKHDIRDVIQIGRLTYCIKDKEKRKKQIIDLVDGMQEL
jgi:holliday junction DNA helicase RuvB